MLTGSRVLASVALALTAIATPSSVQAQQEDYGEGEYDLESCGTLTGGCGINLHKMLSTGPGTSGMGQHSECLECQKWDTLLHEWVGVLWTECHPLAFCGSNFAAVFGNKAAESYRLALAAAESDNVEQLLGIGSLAAGHVVYNPQRQSIQVLDCSGQTVVANFIVAPERGVKIAQLLPEVGESMAGIAQAHADFLTKQSAGSFPVGFSTALVLLGIAPATRIIRRRT